MPRIGLVCEGETDRVAIEWYVRKSLVERGFSEITVCKIPNYTDQTSKSKDIHGCTMVLAWLSQPPGKRQRFLVELFGGGLGTEKFDAIVVHLDADNLSKREFRQHVRNQYSMTVKNPRLPEKRGMELRRIIMSVAKLDKLSRGYAIAVAVESTETWCLSSFRNISGDAESISGSDLVQQFMSALHRFENRPIGSFTNVDKTAIRWERFCRHQSTKVELLELQCYHYKKFISDLVRVLE